MGPRENKNDDHPFPDMENVPYGDEPQAGEDDD